MFEVEKLSNKNSRIVSKLQSSWNLSPDKPFSNRLLTTRKTQNLAIEFKTIISETLRQKKYVIINVWSEQF